MVAAGAARADLPPTVAADGGVAALLDAVEAHAEHLRRSGEGRERRAARIRLSVGLRAHTVAQAALGELPAERWAAVAAGQAPVDALVVDALEAALRALRGAEGVPGGAPAPADPSPADC
jgi:hypothetical protein